MKVFGLALSIFFINMFSLKAYSAGDQPPKVAEILAKYDAIMGPKVFEGDMVMTAWREDGTEKSYDMHVIKKDDDKTRIWFKKPASVAGQEMLRLGDNSWIYLPNLKRATRIASRDSFQGGDFNNADVLRANYQSDYDGKAEAGEGETWLLTLKAKSSSAAYDLIKLWVDRKTTQPKRSEYYGASGKLMRSAKFSEPKEFGAGYTRPHTVEMKNELIPARHSTMVMTSINNSVEIPDTKFTLNDMGK